VLAQLAIRFVDHKPVFTSIASPLFPSGIIGNLSMSLFVGHWTIRCKGLALCHSTRDRDHFRNNGLLAHFQGRAKANNGDRLAPIDSMLLHFGFALFSQAQLIAQSSVHGWTSTRSQGLTTHRYGILWPRNRRFLVCDGRRGRRWFKSEMLQHHIVRLDVLQTLQLIGTEITHVFFRPFFRYCGFELTTIYSFSKKQKPIRAVTRTPQTHSKDSLNGRTQQPHSTDTMMTR
jgi:hypothetical protein